MTVTLIESLFHLIIKLKMTIKVIPLGAGQDVGRSCVIVELGGKRMMFDCGLHMVSEQKFPDFHFLMGVSG